MGNDGLVSTLWILIILINTFILIYHILYNNINIVIIIACIINIILIYYQYL
jgi:hypothetical protein